MRLCLIPLLLAGCGGPWAAAKKNNTAAAYSLFVGQHPTHKRAARAAELSEERAFSEAERTNSVDGWRNYLRTFSGSSRAAEAFNLLADLEWTDAQRQNSVASYTSFRARYPRHGMADEANNRIEKLAFQDALSADTVRSWGTFLVRYPNGQLHKEATERLDEASWRDAANEQTYTAMVGYTESFPTGLHALEAQDFLRLCDPQSVLPVVSVQGSFKPVRQQSKLSASVAKRIEREYLGGWHKKYRLERTRTEAPGRREGGDPRRTFRVAPENGVLFFRYFETEGRAFEPSGFGTDIRLEIELWACKSVEPVWSETITASTPDVVRGVGLSQLYSQALEALDDALARTPPPNISK